MLSRAGGYECPTNRTNSGAYHLKPSSGQLGRWGCGVLCGYGVPLRMQAKLRAVVSGGDGVRVLCNALGLSAHHSADHSATLILASPDEEVSSRSSWLGDHARCSRRAAGYRNSAHAQIRLVLLFEGASSLWLPCRSPPAGRHRRPKKQRSVPNPGNLLELRSRRGRRTLAGRGYHSRPRGDVNQHPGNGFQACHGKTADAAGFDPWHREGSHTPGMLRS